MSTPELKRKLEENKKKLEDLRAKRAAREHANAHDSSAGTAAPAAPQSADILRDVERLIGSSSPSPTTSHGGEGGAGPVLAVSSTIETKSRVVNLSRAAGPTFDIPPPPAKITIETGSQTTGEWKGTGTGTGTDDGGGDTERAALEAERKRLDQKEAAVREMLRKIEEAKRREEEKKEEDKKIKVMSAADRKQIMESKEFSEFLTKAALFTERALDSYDIMTNYRIETEGKVSEQKDEANLRRRFILSDSARTVGRPVTSIDWSPKHPELLLASYAGQEDSMSMDPDGTVLIWNTHLTSRAEYYFYCQSAVLAAQFHPSNPKLIVGGTASGEVVIWDTREKSSPVNRTSLSKGHTHSVFALSCIPIANRNHNIVSVSSDGQLCVWSDNNLHVPTNEVMLRGRDSKEEITTNSFDFPARDSNTIVLASDEGNLYKTRVYEEKGIYETIKAHDAPITNIKFHPVNNKSPSAVSDLFLTSSYDWTVKLWSNKKNKPIYTFESARDYVYDVQWSPVHAGIFASGDGAGRLDVWNINNDTEVPTYTTQIEEKAPSGERSAISRLKWSESGKEICVGTSTGALHVYEVSEAIHNPDPSVASAFYDKIHKKMTEIPA